MKWISLFIIPVVLISCQEKQETTPQFATAKTVIPDSIINIATEEIILDAEDKMYGSYLVVQPKVEDIKGVLVLFPGLGQRPENIFEDTRLHEYASKHGLLTIGYAGVIRMSVDDFLKDKINIVLSDAIERFDLYKNKFVLGGFSAGGTIALRYTEMCKENPDAFPIVPQAVFMADSPTDLFHTWKLFKQMIENNHSKISVDEAKWVEKIYKGIWGGTPDDSPEVFNQLTPFRIDTEQGSHEKYLKEIPVRAYHDVDIAWRLKNRNQTATFSNFVASSELINRLMLMGNDRAEFMQSFETGYRKDGKRHPHSWSIIDEKECVDWIRSILL